MPGERIDMGNLYRILRSLETRGPRRARRGTTAAPGPAKRIYVITDSGRRVLDQWVGAFSKIEQQIDSFRQTVRRGEGVNMHHRRQTTSRRRGVGHRWYEPERVLERLEEYQRDLEQELADVADLIKRLKREKAETV